MHTIDEKSAFRRNQIPPGIDQALLSVRPVIFEDPAIGFPSVPGTGYLLKLFGEIFFITARHVVDGYNFDVNNIRVPYSLQRKDCIPFIACDTYTSTDADDTYHVDIIILRADRANLKPHLFGPYGPFDITADRICREYNVGQYLYFKGIVPAQNMFDYEANYFKLEFAIGDARYNGPAPYMFTHVATPNVTQDCPDFDGMSGSPLYSCLNPYTLENTVKFAGMLLMASREHAIMRFMSAEHISGFLLDYFIGGLSQETASKKLLALLNWYFPDIAERYRNKEHPYIISYLNI